MIKGEKIILRATEPNDLDTMYQWENDVRTWHVTNTFIPFSKNTLQKYLESVQDIFSDKQLRLIISENNSLVGMIDLFDYEPFHQRAGIGILIADELKRNNGLATDALETLIKYCKQQLGIRILFCNILEDNLPSLHLFEKCGFQKNGIKPNWHKSGDKLIGEYFLQIEL